MTEIEVHVAELDRLFNAIDPSPFSSRDLNPRAEEFIVNRAKDLPRDAPPSLVVRVDRAPGETAFVGDPLRRFFERLASMPVSVKT